MELVKYVDQLFKRYKKKKRKLKTQYRCICPLPAFLFCTSKFVLFFLLNLMQLSAPYFQRPYISHHTVFMC